MGKTNNMDSCQNRVALRTNVTNVSSIAEKTAVAIHLFVIPCLKAYFSGKCFVNMHHPELPYI